MNGKSGWEPAIDFVAWLFIAYLWQDVTAAFASTSANKRRTRTNALL
jgi:hypothetical protein